MKVFMSLALLALSSSAALASESIIRCDFGKDECHARITLCPATESDCHPGLVVDCTGYEDSYLTRADGVVLVQGITSLRNPMPPSIVIERSDAAMQGDAHLFASFGSLAGRCRAPDENQ